MSAIGYLFLNPDTGTEFSRSHPIDSGECLDAENVRVATAEVLLEEMLDAWRACEEMRIQRDMARMEANNADAARSDDLFDTYVDLAEANRALAEANNQSESFENSKFKF